MKLNWQNIFTIIKKTLVIVFGSFFYIAFLIDELKIMALGTGLLSIWILYPQDQKLETVNKNTKIKIIVTIAILIPFVSSFFESYKAYNAPVPQITILSSTEKQRAIESYNLEFKIEDANNIMVNQELIIPKNNLFKIIIPLNTTSTDIKIEASNNYKYISKTITIQRDETEEEMTARLEKEKQETELIAQEEAERKAKKIADLKELIESDIKQVTNFEKDVSIYRETIVGIELEADMFNLFAKSVKEAKNSNNIEIQNLGKELEPKLQKLQAREFPKMRKKYKELAEKELWINDIDVNIKGNSNNIIEFLHYSFVTNKNIAETHKIMKDILKKLRFDRVNYKWSEYSEYSYFELESPLDNDVIYIES